MRGSIMERTRKMRRRRWAGKGVGLAGRSTVCLTRWRAAVLGHICNPPGAEIGRCVQTACLPGVMAGEAWTAACWLRTGCRPSSCMPAPLLQEKGEEEGQRRQQGEPWLEALLHSGAPFVF